MTVYVHNDGTSKKLEPYMACIGRKRAWPSVCPQCGTTVKIRECLTLSDCLQACYSDPQEIYSQEVPGWKGFKRWYFVCHHESPMKSFIYEPNPLLALIPKHPSDWSGKYIPIPLEIRA